MCVSLLIAIFQNRFPDAVVINGCYTNSERLPNTCNMSLLGKNLQGQYGNEKQIRSDQGHMQGF